MQVQTSFYQFGAIRNPELIGEIANNFGSQVCVVAIDANYEDGQWVANLNGGRVSTEEHMLEWHRRQKAGEPVNILTSMTHDGVKGVSE